jgi:hypothetical protein
MAHVCSPHVRHATLWHLTYCQCAPRCRHVYNVNKRITVASSKVGDDSNLLAWKALLIKCDGIRQWYYVLHACHNDSNHNASVVIATCRRLVGQQQGTTVITKVFAGQLKAFTWLPSTMLGNAVT